MAIVHAANHVREWIGLMRTSAILPAGYSPRDIFNLAWVTAARRSSRLQVPCQAEYNRGA
jgi:hypothetical protein